MSIRKPPTPLPNAFEELDRVQPPRRAEDTRVTKLPSANTYPPEENGETGEFAGTRSLQKTEPNPDNLAPCNREDGYAYMLRGIHNYAEGVATPIGPGKSEH